MWFEAKTWHQLRAEHSVCFAFCFSFGSWAVRGGSDYAGRKWQCEPVASLGSVLLLLVFVQWQLQLLMKKSGFDFSLLQIQILFPFALFYLFTSFSIKRLYISQLMSMTIAISPSKAQRVRISDCCEHHLSLTSYFCFPPCYTILATIMMPQDAQPRRPHSRSVFLVLFLPTVNPFHKAVAEAVVSLTHGASQK